MTDNGDIRFYIVEEEYGWLSNFWRAGQRMPWPERFARVVLTDDLYVKTNEHWYQANKADDLSTFCWIAKAPHPYLAMQAGRVCLKPNQSTLRCLRPGWEQVKVDVMLAGLRAKFSQNPDIKAKLLATGEATIHEDSPSDAFWGGRSSLVCGCSRPNHAPHNTLGKLLMQVREELRMQQMRPSVWDDIFGEPPSKPSEPTYDYANGYGGADP